MKSKLCYILVSKEMVSLILPMSKFPKKILMLGCFDTKAEEFLYLYQCLQAQNQEVLTMNVGVLGSTKLFPVDIETEEVVEQAGASLSEIRAANQRETALLSIGEGAEKMVQKLVAQGKVKGIIGMGGGVGTFLTLKGMQAAPFGLPKLCISTLAGKDLANQLNNKDILLMPSIVDIAGLNSLLKEVISKAAAALTGMAGMPEIQADQYLGRVAVSMFGNSSTCVKQCSELLREAGYEVFTFHANGLGGRALESLVRTGYFDGVLEVTTTEIADYLFQGVCSAGSDRLTAAVELGIPLVVVPGCLDMVNFSRPDSVPEEYRGRQFHFWTPEVTLMRTTPEENVKMAAHLMEKLNASEKQVDIFLPLQGLSALDKAGSDFYNPESNSSLFETMKAQAKETTPVQEVDAHLNDVEFSEKIVAALLAKLK